MKTISRYLMTLVALFAMTAGAWAEGTVYSSSVDIRNLQPDDILIEGASLIDMETNNYKFKIIGYYLRSQDDINYSQYNSTEGEVIGGVDRQVKVLTGGVIEYIRSGNRYTYTPCDAEYNPLNAWIVTQIEDLGSDSYRVQITAYQYGSAEEEANEVEANVNPGEKTNLIDQFNKAKNSGLTVNVGSDDNAYSLNFDKEAIGSILEGNPEEVNLETTYEETKQKIGSTDVLAKLNVNLTNGSNALNFNAGKVVANLKFLGNIPTGRELQTWYFDNVSNLPTEMISTVYDAINKMATITMSHFSTYGLLLYTPAGIADISEDGTSAKFEMPDNDLTVEYELVRDMQDATNPVAFSGIPDDGKISVKKGDDGKYQPIEALNIQLIDPLAAIDAQNIISAEGITIKVLLGDDSTGPVVYDDENPITLEAFLADMKPGFYWIKAEGTADGTYDGTVYSTEMWLTEFSSYDLTLSPAQSDKVSVTIGGTAVSADDNGVIKSVEAGQKVVLKTTSSDYIIRKAAVKKTEAAAPVTGTIYLWESPEGTPVETGGTIAYVNGDGDRLNYLNSGYYTICLNGKKANMNDETASANAGHMVVTLDNALAAGDVISITGYITKNESKKSSAYIVYENGTNAESPAFGDEANIDATFSGSIQTKTVTVAEEAAGSKTITLTRGQTGTNLFITKLEIIRGAANN